MSVGNEHSWTFAMSGIPKNAETRFQRIFGWLDPNGAFHGYDWGASTFVMRIGSPAIATMTTDNGLIFPSTTPGSVVFRFTPELLAEMPVDISIAATIRRVVDGTERPFADGAIIFDEGL